MIDHVDSSASDASTRLKTALDRHGYALIDGLRDTESMVDFMRRLGLIIPPGVAMGHGLHDLITYEVRVRNEGQGTKDEYGNPIISTTPASFDFHTDGYNSPVPPRYVGLFRTDDSDEAPLSSVADSLQLDGVDEGLWDRLFEARFPSAIGLVPILENIGTVRRMRFNGVEIRRWSNRTVGLESQDISEFIATIDKLSAAFSDLAENFVLRRYDCEILDNWRMCHARSELRSASERVVHRVWVAPRRHDDVMK
jgi:hypothetical protein